MEKTPGSCDVLVIGTGLAGVVAALRAAAEGARVVLAGAGPVFSGAGCSSHRGAGFLVPRGGDAAGFSRFLVEAGGPGVDRGEVEAFSREAPPALEWLARTVDGADRSLGGALGDELGLDDPAVSWVRASRGRLADAFAIALARAGVEALPGWELVDLATREGRIAAAELHDGPTHRCVRVSCGAAVLATGPIGSLAWPGRFAARVPGQGAALARGCVLRDPDLIDLALALRGSGRLHPLDPALLRVIGPHSGLEGATPRDWTLRSLASAARRGAPGFAVDRALAARGATGAPIDLEAAAHEGDAELRGYRSWLLWHRGVGRTERMVLVHALAGARGGIDAGADGETGVPGLFTCGSAAPLRLVDRRIEGIDATWALVTALRAGAGAAAGAGERPRVEDVPLAAVPCGLDGGELDRVLGRAGLLVRRAYFAEDRASLLDDAIDELRRLRAPLREREGDAVPEPRGSARAHALMARNALLLAEAGLAAARLRDDAGPTSRIEVRVVPGGEPQVEARCRHM